MWMMKEYTLGLEIKTISVWAKSEKQAQFLGKDRLARMIKQGKLPVIVTGEENIDTPCHDCARSFPASRTGKDKNGDVLCFTCLGKRQTMF